MYAAKLTKTALSSTSKHHLFFASPQELRIAIYEYVLVGNQIHLRCLANPMSRKPVLDIFIDRDPARELVSPEPSSWSTARLPSDTQR
jgi:hypothetical protein